LKSWVESANRHGTDFPIENLPYGVFRRRGRTEVPRVGVAIGDHVLDIGLCEQNRLFEGSADHAELLSPQCQDLQRNVELVTTALVPMEAAEMFLPYDIGNYTDFYASIHHASRVGKLFRPDNPLFPNYKQVPIAYHGRASSVVVSGSTIRRPMGQTKMNSFGPTEALDYEIEMGAFIGVSNRLGEPVAIVEAASHVFGLCLLNDWSARDVQAWESQPLGPFLSKSFATSVSPWVVSMDALAPYRAPAADHEQAPLPYLSSEQDREHGAFDISLEVWIQSEQMRADGIAAARVSRGNLREMYWTFAQMVAHHTSNGCNLRTGDLIGSGTTSGSSEDSRGCLLEITSRGTEPLSLPNGETRRFLENGDEVILRGYCERDGLPRIGFGECRGTIAG
jgi:fumarylacetoacetase